jgi:arsenate reductase (thioredoxin)
MNEIGIDISHHRSKGMNEFFDTDVDIVVMVCDDSSGVCPMFPGAKKIIHESFPDPFGKTGTEEEVLETFRNLRDTITGWIDRNVEPGGALHIE